MPHIICDDRKTEKLLKKISDTVLDNGAWLHEDLGIVCENGALSLTVEGPSRPKSTLIKIPENLLVPAEDAGFSVKGDDLLCKPDTKKLSDTQIALTEMITELYNLTGKIKWHRENCLWSTLRPYKDVTDALFEGRQVSKKRQDYLDFLHQKNTAPDEDEFICQSYIKTRVLGQKTEDEEEPTAKIMPIVDFMNHHLNGATFSFAVPHEGTQALSVGIIQPVNHSRECFAYYNQMDTLDCYLSYYFIDQDVPFLRSRAMNLHVGDLGEIKILTTSGVVKHKNLPKELNNLRRIMPKIARNDDGNLTISHMPITMHSMPHATRRILRVIIGTLCEWSVPNKKIFQLVHDAEQTLINANIDFHKSIIGIIDKHTDAKDKQALAPLRQICEQHLTKLYKYNYDKGFFSRQFGADVAKINVQKENKVQTVS